MLIRSLNAVVPSLLDVEILALVLAGRLVGKGESSPFSPFRHKARQRDSRRLMTIRLGKRSVWKDVIQSLAGFSVELLK